jgi:hypothetical protein
MPPSDPLIARLRAGSVLTTQRGAVYRVVEPILQVAKNGSLVPTFVVERIRVGYPPHTVLMPIGLLANLLRRGCRHKPGPGAAINWSTAERRPMTRDTAVRRILANRSGTNNLELAGSPACSNSDSK